jgi:hypothetical protein
MADRYTAKDAERCAKQLADALKVPFGGCWKRTKGGSSKSIIGCWKMDYSAIWGGAVIEEIVNEGGGITHPFSSTRRSPREFCKTIHFAMQVMDYKKRRK